MNDKELITQLSTLIQAAKKPLGAALLQKKLGGSVPGAPSRVAPLLFHELPKLRKNAARLIGALQLPDHREIMKALQNEDTRFVRPSLLLALGNIAAGPLINHEEKEAITHYLETYQVEPPAEESEKKHASDEEEALRKARGKALPLPTLPSPLPEAVHQKCSFILYTPKGKELFQGDYSKLLEKRDWKEAWASLPNIKALLLLLDQVFGKDLSLPYRLSLPASSDRKQDAASLSHTLSSLSNGRLVNNPSHYLFLLQPHGKNGFLARFTTFADPRFSYRVSALPASMHPSTAASVIQIAKSLSPAASSASSLRILDPCCGSGTLLFERAAYEARIASGAKKKPLFLQGVDISKDALTAARSNEAAFWKSAFPLPPAPSSFHFLREDVRKALQNKNGPLSRPFDEIYCNLPFGIRTGSHEQNLSLYEALLLALPRLLVPGGTAALFSMEGSLLERLLKQQPDMRLAGRFTLQAGGLEPKLYILIKAQPTSSKAHLPDKPASC